MRPGIKDAWRLSWLGVVGRLTRVRQHLRRVKKSISSRTDWKAAFELDSNLLLSSGRHGEDSKRQYFHQYDHETPLLDDLADLLYAVGIALMCCFEPYDSCSAFWPLFGQDFFTFQFFNIAIAYIINYIACYIFFCLYALQYFQKFWNVFFS
jgi:hypothetical protein